MTGRVRKRRSAGRGTRYQAVARCNGREVPLGTYDSFEDAVDAYQREAEDIKINSTPARLTAAAAAAAQHQRLVRGTRW